MTYSELQVTTHFSFLRGASSPEELVAMAATMGMPALGVTDRNSVAGVVRMLYAQEKRRRATRRMRRGWWWAAVSTSCRVRRCWSGPRTAPPGAGSPAS
ncbi:PHP domain-containing protein [Sphingomonas sp. MMS24-JH45]